MPHSAVLPFHRLRLELEAEHLMKLSGDMESERLQDIYERLEELDAASAETKAARILHGLGESPPSLPLSLSLFPSHLEQSPCLPQPTVHGGGSGIIWRQTDSAHL